MTSKALLEIMAKAVEKEIYPDVNWEEDTTDDYKDSVRKAMQSALNAAKEAGYVLTPLEPTEEMAKAGLRAFIGAVKRTPPELKEKYKDDPAALKGMEHFDMGALTRNSGEMKAVYTAMLSASGDGK